MISLYGEPDGNNFQRCQDSRASQCEDKEYGQSDRGDIFPPREAGLGELREEQMPNGP